MPMTEKERAQAAVLLRQAEADELARIEPLAAEARDLAARAADLAARLRALEAETRTGAGVKALQAAKRVAPRAGYGSLRA